MPIPNAPTEKELDVALASAKRIAELTARVALLEAQPARSRVLLADSLLTASQVSFDFQNLSQNFQSLEIVGYTRTDRVDTIDGIELTFNGDTGANYDWYWTDSRNDTGTSTPVGGSDDGVADTTIDLGFFPAASAPANTFGSFVILIPYYTNINAFKTTRLTGGHLAAQTNQNIFINDGFATWRSIVAINRITLSPIFGTNFVANSHISVYGLV